MEKKSKKKRYSLSLADKTDMRLDELSEEFGYSRSELVDIAVKRLYKSLMKNKQQDK